MFATIRRYMPKPPDFSKDALDDLSQKLQDQFVPTVQDIPGFHGYYAMNVADRELVTISVFDDRAGAEESTRRAAAFIASVPMPFEIGQPMISEGNVIAAAEARRTVGAE
jgi:hypothetical protein